MLTAGEIEFTYPVGMLRNLATGRFHPIVFRPAPAPSEDIGAKVSRYRSRGHHTEGFATHEEALASIRAVASWSWRGVEWEWDGTDIPTITTWFSVVPEGAETVTETRLPL